MPLDKAKLAQDLKNMGTAAIGNPDPDPAKHKEPWSAEQAMDELASIIDAFVRSAKVTGVAVEVRDVADVVIGTGIQTGTGKLE